MNSRREKKKRNEINLFAVDCARKEINFRKRNSNVSYVHQFQVHWNATREMLARFLFLSLRTLGLSVSHYKNNNPCANDDEITFELRDDDDEDEIYEKRKNYEPFEFTKISNYSPLFFWLFI